MLLASVNICRYIVTVAHILFVSVSLALHLNSNLYLCDPRMNLARIHPPIAAEHKNHLRLQEKTGSFMSGQFRGLNVPALC